MDSIRVDMAHCHLDGEYTKNDQHVVASSLLDFSKQENDGKTISGQVMYGKRDPDIQYNTTPLGKGPFLGVSR